MDTSGSSTKAPRSFETALNITGITKANPLRGFGHEHLRHWGLGLHHWCRWNDSGQQPILLVIAASGSTVTLGDERHSDQLHWVLELYLWRHHGPNLYHRFAIYLGR